MKNNFKKIFYLLKTLMLVISSLGFQPVAAQQAAPVTLPLYPSLAWGTASPLTQNILLDQQPQALAGSVFSTQEPINIDDDANGVAEYYASPNLARMGWQWISNTAAEDGLSSLYFNEQGYFLTVQFEVCGDTSSMVCLNVWQSEASSLSPAPVAPPADQTDITPNVVTFNKQTPANGAINLATSGVGISWTAYTGGSLNRYRYCYDTSNDNACDTSVGAAGWTSVWSGTSATLPTLSANKTYYWHVQAVLNDNTKIDSDNGSYWAFSTLGFAAFSKTSPLNNTTNVTPVVTLLWQTNPSASGGYKYCISEASVTCNTWVYTATTTTSVTLTLAPNKTYQWQVRAYDGANGTGNSVDADNGTWWKFSTVNVRDFAKTAPANNVTNQPNLVTLSWQTNPDATGGYKYCISESSVACFSWVSTSATSVQVSVSPKKTYQWQVRAYNNSGGYNEANSGVYWKFSTIQIADFGKTSPASGATNQPAAITLQWLSNPDATGGYKYCITPLNTSCSTWTAPSPASSTSATVIINPQTTYQWQVRAYNTTGNYVEADGGTTWAFSTVNIASFSKTFPAQSATNLPPTLTLQWQANSSAVKYQYCLSEINTACSFVDVNPLNATSLQVTLAPKKTYWWQVRAVDAGGNSLEANNTAYWTFSTVNMASFDKLLPANNAVNVSPVAPITLQWQSNPDATGGYQYCFAESPNTCSTWISTTDISAKVYGLALAKTYQWQVRAINGSGLSIEANNGTWWQVSTIKKFARPDFNGDGLLDIAVFRSSAPNVWYVRGQGSVQYGTSGDLPAAGDYNGDGKTDYVVYRPSNNTFYTRGVGSLALGTAGSVPVPGDYNGDGKTDYAVFLSGTWTIQGQPSITYGAASDVPVPADYNGDGKTEIAIYRPSTGVWYIRGVGSFVFSAASGDILIPGDYDGDGKADLAYFRPSTDGWSIRGSAGSDITTTYGAASDIPLALDFNNDGKLEISVFRPSTGEWFARGIGVIAAYGASGDLPIANYQVTVP